MSFDAQNFWDFCWDWVYDIWVVPVLYVVAMFAWFLLMPFVVIFVSLSFLCLMERGKSRKFIFIENGKWHLRFGAVVTCFLDRWLGPLMILVWVVIWVSFVFDLYLWSGSVFVFDLFFFFSFVLLWFGFVFDLYWWFASVFVFNLFFFLFLSFFVCVVVIWVCGWSLFVIWVCVCVWSPFLFFFFFFFFHLCCCDLGLRSSLLGLSSSLLGLIGKNTENKL